MNLSKIEFQNTYLNLPERFYQKINPKGFSKPRLRSWNKEFAQFLGITLNAEQDSGFLEQVFSGNKIMPSSQPLALAYSGHQFGHFNPQLGDGRAHLLGELRGANGKLYDVQLKGSGQTRYSRRGDGLSPMGPVVREYLVSEFMHYFGVPTTRSLAIVETGEAVFRENTHSGGVLTRVAESHIRVGHFEYLAYQRDTDGINRLINFVIQKSFPSLIDAIDKPLALFQIVVRRQAALISQWMGLGFVHGVMNTDNTSVSGITIDYGPCAFLDETDFNKVFSSIDRSGRYAYNKQPYIQQWNLAKLAQTLLVVYSDKEVDAKVKEFEKTLEDYIHIFDENWQALFLKKIGFNNQKNEDGLKILEQLLQYFIIEKIDFTLGFRELSNLIDSQVPPAVFKKIENYMNLVNDWKQLATKESSLIEVKNTLNSTNPFFIPRNHIIENIIQDCYKDDWSKFYRFEKALKNPYQYDQSHKEFMLPPKPEEVITCTFCGT